LVGGFKTTVAELLKAGTPQFAGDFALIHPWMLAGGGPKSYAKPVPGYKNSGILTVERATINN
jgi:hypothetical protein